jgi:Obg family GTPase CgtA-like protein
VPQPDVPDGIIEEWALERADMGFEVVKQDGVYYVDGSLIQEIMAKTDPNDVDSMRHYQKLLKDFGVINALRQEGARTGDTVCLEGMEFDFMTDQKISGYDKEEFMLTSKQRSALKAMANSLEPIYMWESGRYRKRDNAGGRSAYRARANKGHRAAGCAAQRR